MAKRKLKHFAENFTFPHFFQPGVDDLANNFHLKGKWKSNFFKNNNPLVLELGCGKGEYTVGLARKNHKKNYIGIDIKGARMWNGASVSLQEKLTNVAFLRTHVELIHMAFEKNEVDEIWITFPDPQPRNSKEKRRLTSPRFLNIYSKLLKSNGIIHLKTDNISFFEYTLDIIKKYNHPLLLSTKDVYSECNIIEAFEIQTFYEKMFLSQGMKICYLKFQLAPETFNETSK